MYADRAAHLDLKAIEAISTLRGEVEQSLGLEGGPTGRSRARNSRSAPNWYSGSECGTARHAARSCHRDKSASEPQPVADLRLVMTV
jgi:hypothetical protein